MERMHTDDHFEKFLRDSVEDFRMFPSDRIWTSLYNNLHPGKTRPSIAVSVLLISAMIFIGFAHSDNNKRNAEMAIASIEISDMASLDAKKNTGTSANFYGITQTEKVLAAPAKADQTDLINNNLHVSTGLRNQPSTQYSVKAGNERSEAREHRNTFASSGKNRQADARRNRNPLQTNYVSSENNLLANQQNSWMAPANMRISIHEPDLFQIPHQAALLTMDAEAPGSDIAKLNIADAKLKALAEAEEEKKRDREWMEHYAFVNKPKKKLKSKLQYELYATPSIGYRRLRDNTRYPMASQLIVPGNSSSFTEPEYDIVHKPSLNLEAGYSLVYPANKTIRLKAGVQINYSNYTIHAMKMDHPTATSMLVNNPDAGQVDVMFMPSSIANVQNGEKVNKLQNNSLQVSIPIGADLRLAGNGKWQWFAGATLQPTYVMSGNAYLLSADMKNYVFDASFVRKWNLNAGFETFVSYKLNQAIQINAGPQLRYQFRSSFSDRYTFDDRFYNIGIKLGIVQRF